MYGDDIIEVDVTWPGTVSDKTWVGYIQPEDILAAKDAVKPIAVDMGDLGTYVISADEHIPACFVHSFAGALLNCRGRILIKSLFHSIG